MISQPKFKLNVGAHPSLVFQTNTVILNGVTRDVMTSQRYFARNCSELLPDQNTSIGIYYLQSHGFEPDATQNTYFSPSTRTLHISRLPGITFCGSIPSYFTSRWITMTVTSTPPPSRQSEKIFRSLFHPSSTNELPATSLRARISSGT